MRFKFIKLFFLVALFLVSCKKEEYKDITFSGNINGHIERVCDEFGNDLNKKDIKVEIVGENIFTFTDDMGKFSLKNVTTGTYDIKFSREDTDNYELQCIQFLGGDKSYIIESKIVLLQASTTVPSNLSILIENETIHFQCDISPDASLNLPRYIRFYVYSDDSVSPNSHLYYFDKEVNSGSNVSISNSIAFFEQFNIDTFYVKAYGFTKGYYYGPYNNIKYYPDIQYIDRNTGEIIYPGLNVSFPSNITHFNI